MTFRARSVKRSYMPAISSWWRGAVPHTVHSQSGDVYSGVPQARSSVSLCTIICRAGENALPPSVHRFVQGVMSCEDRKILSRWDKKARQGERRAARLTCLAVRRSPQLLARTRRGRGRRLGLNRLAQGSRRRRRRCPQRRPVSEALVGRVFAPRLLRHGRAASLEIEVVGLCFQVILHELQERADHEKTHTAGDVTEGREDNSGCHEYQH